MVPRGSRVPIGGSGAGSSGDGEGLLAAEGDEDDGTGDGHGSGQGHPVRGHGRRRRKHKEEKDLAAWETVTCEAGVKTECFILGETTGSDAQVGRPEREGERWRLREKMATTLPFRTLLLIHSNFAGEAKTSQ